MFRKKGRVSVRKQLTRRKGRRRKQDEAKKAFEIAAQTEQVQSPTSTSFPWENFTEIKAEPPDTPDDSNIDSCHFDESQFEANGQDGQKKLNPDAVPLVFPTHILVVHDPSTKRKCNTPQPKQPHFKILKKDLLEKAVESDHKYAKNAEEMFNNISNITENVCTPITRPKVVNKVSSSVGKNGVPSMKQNGPPPNMYDPLLKTYERKKINNQGKIQPETLQKQNRKSPPVLCISPPSPAKIMRQPNHSTEELEKPNECLKTPEKHGPAVVNKPMIASPGESRDALSFLQFMLPQQWMAFSESSGIQLTLFSKSRPKAIQRSIYMPFKGEEVEFYVHALRIPNNHKIFDSINLKQLEGLTRVSLGNYVDSIINVVELFGLFKVCCGVTDDEFLQEWRKFDDCILDSNLFGEEMYKETVRSVECLLLVSQDCERCTNCENLFEEETI